jgi:hypothetical protein
MAAAERYRDRGPGLVERKVVKASGKAIVAQIKYGLDSYVHPDLSKL